MYMRDEDVPKKAIQAYSDLGQLFGVFSGRIEADENAARFFSKLGYQGVLSRLEKILTEVLCLNRPSDPLLKTAEVALIYALTPTILVKLGLPTTKDAGTTMAKELDSLFAAKDVLRQRFQREIIAEILVHCCDKRGFDILFENVDPRSIGYAVQFLDGTKFSTWIGTLHKKYAVSAIDTRPLLFTLTTTPWQRFSLIKSHHERIIEYISENLELRKLLMNSEDFRKLTYTGPYGYLENGAFYQTNVADLFKMLLICGTSSAINMFFELSALTDSFYVDGTYPESVSRSLRGLINDRIVALEHPRRDFYNQLYSALVKSLSEKNVLDGLHSKHAVLRWLTLKALEDTAIERLPNRDQILNSLSNDTCEVVKELAIQLRKTT